VRAFNVTNTSLVLHMFDNANSEPPLSGVNQTLSLMFSLDLEKKHQHSAQRSLRSEPEVVR
jgi:hypothetical protein